MSGLRVAIVGATGLVGRTLQRVLEETEFPVSDLLLLASERSAGNRLPFAGSDLEVKLLDERHFAGCDVVFFTTGADLSRRYALLAAERVNLVVDNSSAFRLDPTVHLIVPEVNGHLLEKQGAGTSGLGIVANPNCSTIQMVVALHPLNLAFGLEMVVVSTYQSVSGSGAKGIRALEYELEAGERAPGSPYPHSIAFNVVPHIDALDKEGWSGEEHKMIHETRKIMDLPSLHMVPTAVRVPVRIGHSQSIYARFSQRIDAVEAANILSRAPGIVVRDEPGNSRYPMAKVAEGRDEVFVGRIRKDTVDDFGLALWVVADNLRKGAATNAVQIASKALGGGPAHAESQVTSRESRDMKVE